MSANQDDHLSATLEGVPPEPGQVDPALMAREARAGKTDDCPSLAELLTEPSGLPPDRAAFLAVHAPGCAYCRPWVAHCVIAPEHRLGTRTYEEQLRDHPELLAATPQPTSPASDIPRDDPARQRADKLLTDLTGVKTLFEENPEEALRFIRPYLGLLLRGAGLVPDHADAFEAYLQSQGKKVGGDAPVLTQWLRGFAQTVLHQEELPYEPTPLDWADYFKRALFERALQQGLPEQKETRRTKRLRAEAVKHGIISADQLDSFLLQFSPSGSLEGYCAEIRTRVEAEFKELTGRCLKVTV